MAFGNDIFTAGGGAVKDIFQGFAAFEQAEGKQIEAQSYTAAAKFAEQNAAWAQANTAVKAYQTQHEAFKVIGGQEAAVASSGFDATGSALDILADSMSQAAISKALVTQQGEITEMGYQEQQRAYLAMAASSEHAADAARLSGYGAFIGAGVKALSVVGAFAG